MKNRIISLLTVTFMLFALCITSVASEKLNYVTDTAELLTSEELIELYSMTKEISEKYDFGIYIVTVDDFTEYVDTYEVTEAAETIYFEYELGKGNEKNGILLLLSMSERDYAIYAYGYGNIAFTDYGKDYLSEEFLDNFAKDDWYGGFYDYVYVSGQMLDKAINGNPVDIEISNNKNNGRIYGIIICTLIGFVIAVIVKNKLKKQLVSVHTGTEATNFIATKGLELSKNIDEYTHTTTERVYSPKEKESSSGSSRGGTSVNSNGGSSKGGKF